MATMIELLREEHRDIEQMLLVLEEELGNLAGNARPDYQVIQAAIRYFQDYPDCCHHPKEDMVLEKLKKRDPVAAETIGDLHAEHRDESKRLQRVADTIRKVLAANERPWQTLDEVVREFIAGEREHMRMEERVLFPAAAAALHAEDWTEIELQWSEEKDSLFNVAIEERCHSLRDRVLKWCRDDAEAQI